MGTYPGARRGRRRVPARPWSGPSDRVPRRPTIPSLHRIPAALISLAVLAGPGLAPAVASTSEPPATTAAAEELVLGPEHVEAVRARVEQVRADRPVGPQPDAGLAPAASTNPVVTRHAGTDRYATAAALADTWYRDYFWDETKSPFPKEFEKIAFVANGATFADALSGGAAAASWGGPILLTKTDRLPSATKASLAGLRPDAIVVLGGPDAVDATVERALRAYVPTADNVYRVGGSNRWEVSAGTAGLIGRAPVAFVASGENFPDGLSGGAAAGTVTSPLLITKRDSVPSVVMSALQEVRPQRVYVVGGTDAVSDTVVWRLSSTLRVPVTRVSGTDRFAVAAAVAAVHPTQHGATVANGQDWADALAGSAFAGLMGDKLLLLKSDSAPLATQQAIVQHGLTSIDALGGTASVQEKVLTTLRRLKVDGPGAG
ncbi:hypothetical protein GCM10009584_11630 [Ornithinimicrobium humiphilum]|uniref:Putative cell wall binding repeat protein n=1 Tax=Ornithinimicrobium humiphilum TaxID=125288 RepID=A0A543KJQ9_9MICO|nr:cell wall-binding repeat-containing protein [Ornithinimicrobium humiphilum]TQM95266.1 putative cell wall binding repeat protein [Ornithinimicrobium humiphilum]